MRYMLKFSSMTALVLALVSGACLFWVSQQVQQVERQQRQLLASISEEEESLRVLRAEWDYLNRPERLEELSVKYLNMAPASAETLVQSISAIPEPEEVSAPLEISTASAPASGTAKSKTVLAPPVLNQNEAQQEKDFEKVLNSASEGGQ